MPTTRFVAQQEEEKRRMARQIAQQQRAKTDRQMIWLTLAIGLVFVSGALALLGVSMSTITISGLLILIVAVILDFIDKRSRK